MNDRLSSAPAAAMAGNAPPADTAEPALPRGLRLGAYEIEQVLARSSGTVVYLATDHALAMPVAIQEYLPARLVRRDAGLHLRAAEPWQEEAMARGLRAFIDEARLLAHCEHPALVRVNHLFEALGSAYRVMPVYNGQRLADLRNEMIGAPDESALRALLDPLLGALETMHRGGHTHGAVTPSNILLLAGDRPLLLGPGAASHEIGSGLVDSLMATLERGAASNRAADGATGPPPTGSALDLYSLAETIRFCITGEALAPAGTLRAREPLAEAIAREFAPEARPQYSAALLGTLDAALSTFAEDRPLTAAQFRDWLERGVPGGPIRMPPVSPAAVAATLRPAVPPPARTSAPAPARSPSPAAPPALDSTQPMSPWIEPSPDLIDPITPERPPWVAPPLPAPLPRPASARARRHKLLLVTGLAALAAGVLALATGWWSLSPEIQLEPIAGRMAPPPVTATPSALPPPTPAVEPAAALPPPTPAVEPAAAIPAPVASAPAPEPSPSSVTATPESATPEPPASPPPPQADEPERLLAAKPPGAGPANTSARPVRSAAGAGPGPRAACAGRTEFALYRCVQQQCQAKRWAAHPQCAKLRREDRVD